MYVLLSTTWDLENEKYPHKIGAFQVSHAMRKYRPKRYKCERRLTILVFVSNFAFELVFPLSLIIFSICICPVLSFDLINCNKLWWSKNPKLSKALKCHFLLHGKILGCQFCVQELSKSQWSNLAKKTQYKS